MGKKESRAEPKYFSVEDIVEYFDDNPKALVDYVRTGLLKNIPILGVHLAQLAGITGVPLFFGGKACDKFPHGSWVGLRKFANVDHVLSVADKMFPGQ